MSSVNAPQPDASGPAEIFDSTASAPHGGTISAVGIPAGPPQETPVHTGMFNTYDQILHEQFVPIDTITWSVTQTTGHLMWKRAIHPRFCHDAIAYLMGLYNAWSGGIDFNFKVAGTGFHAGAIAIVRIPPNLKPELFRTPASWGLFEYVVIDPKTLEVESLGVSDQRPIAYHYRNFDENNSMTFGGWIAMYVLIPLNTSATGSQQIQIQAFSRPSQNWQPSQLIMPNSLADDLVFPTCYTDYFNFSNKEIMTTFPMYANKLMISPKQVTSTNAVMNCYTTEGDMMSLYNNKDDFDWLPEPSSDVSAHLLPSALEANDFEASPAKLTFTKGFKPLGVAVKNKAFFLNQIVGAKTERWENSTVTWTGVSESKFVTWAIDTPATTVTGGYQMIVVAPHVQMPEKWTDSTYAPPIANESMVYFACIGDDTATRLYGAQIRKLTELFRAARLKGVMPSGMCLLFQIVDTREDLPMGFVKLYKEGFFTSRALEKETFFDLKNIQFVFDSYILRTDPIPTNVAFTQNRILLSKTYSRNYFF